MGLLRAGASRSGRSPNLEDFWPPDGKVVSMTKLPTILTIAALAALPFAAGTAHADEPFVCADGYVASGPYCVNPIYLDNPLFVDPATCAHGFFQGSCVPDTLPAPVDLGVTAYTFQTPAALPVEAIVEPVEAVAVDSPFRPVALYRLLG